MRRPGETLRTQWSEADAGGGDGRLGYDRVARNVDPEIFEVAGPMRRLHDSFFRLACTAEFSVEIIFCCEAYVYRPSR